ncbi:MAG: hypothetical protein RMJ33_02945 [Saprospiraceae bacterium]|nr:hypothetical protein [Saprospiraceae bacterium]MDW8228773.1 hypothetical protein [Saprospiraceae bacterium]
MIYTRYSGGWGCLLIGAVALVLLFYLLRAVLYFLYVVSPVLLIAAIVINWRAVWDTAREVWSLLLERPLSGLLMSVLAVVLYPVTALYLLLRAVGYRRMEQMFGPTPRKYSASEEGEYIDFEEIESHPKSRPENAEDIEIEPIPPPDDLPKDRGKPREGP